MSKRRKHRRAAARADRLRDSGPDASGNYGVNPYTARGHVIEVAPKELRSNPNLTNKPDMIITQRPLDYYGKHGRISEAQYRAGKALWLFWNEAGLVAKVTSGYDPVIVQSSANMDGRIAKWLDAALAYTRLMRAVPYHCQGVVRAVVIEEQTAADWARERGYRHHDAERHGLDRLRSGLQALAQHLGI